MWTIRVGRHFYAQGANPRWYGDPQIATHFDTDDAAHAEKREQGQQVGNPAALAKARRARR